MYPAAWRSRYGDEILAFMEDTYGDGPVPLRARWGMARAGVAEHLAEMGLTTSDRSPADRLRGGALLVLVAWAFFVVGGAVFAKAAEGWEAGSPAFTLRLAGAGFGSVLWAATTGAVVIVLGSAIALPAFVAFLRAGGWSEVRATILRAATVTVLTVLGGSGVVLWARHLTFEQRNGRYWPYSVVVLALASMCVVTVVLWTIAALRTVPRLDLSIGALRRESVLALALVAMMIVIIGGTAVWWGAVATGAPRFLSASALGSPVTPNLLVAGSCMLAGLALALGGARRVAGALRTHEHL